MCNGGARASTHQRNQRTGEDMDPTHLVAVGDDRGKRSYDKRERPKIEIGEGGQYNTTCAKCGARGHMTKMCRQEFRFFLLKVIVLTNLCGVWRVACGACRPVAVMSLLRHPLLLALCIWHPGVRIAGCRVVDGAKYELLEDPEDNSTKGPSAIEAAFAKFQNAGPGTGANAIKVGDRQVQIGTL